MQVSPKQLDRLEHVLGAAIEQAMLEFIKGRPKLAKALPAGGDKRLHHLMAKAAAAVLEARMSGG